jgi:DNA-binding NarL/FixJ family response regulator
MINSDRIRVLSVDDHALLKEGICAIVNAQPDMVVAGTASKGKEAIEAFRVLRPDITLMDLRLPDLSGIDVIMAIRAEFPDARIIILTTYERDVEIQRTLKAGARGYLLKSMPPEQMLDAIRQVHTGKLSLPAGIAAGLMEHLGDESLSNREVEVLTYVAACNRNRDIAERLFIAEETVKVHVKHIMGKLRANDRTQSVTIAARRGIITL